MPRFAHPFSRGSLQFVTRCFLICRYCLIDLFKNANAATNYCLVDMTTTSILFDLDNTLTHRGNTITHYAGAFYQNFANKLLDNLSLDYLAQRLIRQDKGGYAGHEERSVGIRGLEIWQSIPSIQDIADHWQHWIPNNPSPMPGLYKTLEYFKSNGFSLGVITNGSVKAQSAKLSTLQIEEFFDTIIISEACGIKKPETAIFMQALTILNTDARRAYFVGDHPINDYMGALGAGLTPIWLKGFSRWPDNMETPKYSVNSLEESIELINSLIANSS